MKEPKVIRQRTKHLGRSEALQGRALTKTGGQTGEHV